MTVVTSEKLDPVDRNLSALSRREVSIRKTCADARVPAIPLFLVMGRKPYRGTPRTSVYTACARRHVQLESE